MENQENQKNPLEDLSLDKEIKLLQNELVELNKELLICEKLVAKRDSRAKEYLLEIEAIKKDIKMVEQEIELLNEAKNEEEQWDELLGEELDEFLEEEQPTPVAETQKEEQKEEQENKETKE